MKSIQHISKAKFKISTPGVAGSELELDFNPIIDEFNLIGDFTLIHWQARPKGYREWGIYTSSTDTYRSIGELVQNVGGYRSLQLDDQTAKSIPSAVLYSNENKCTCINDKAILGIVSVNDL